eukprot:jgi/Chrzof1/6604/Cz19g02110.t1
MGGMDPTSGSGYPSQLGAYPSAQYAPQGQAAYPPIHAGHNGPAPPYTQPGSQATGYPAPYAEQKHVGYPGGQPGQGPQGYPQPNNQYGGYPNQQAYSYPPTGSYPTNHAPAPPAGSVVHGAACPTGVHVAPNANGVVEEGCDCSAGWILFALGFLFPILWIMALFVPCCSRRQNDRRAALFSGIAFAVYSVIIVVCVVVPLNRAADAYAASMNG